jgi:hypothetical protein
VRLDGQDTLAKAKFQEAVLPERWGASVPLAKAKFLEVAHRGRWDASVPLAKAKFPEEEWGNRSGASPRRVDNKWVESGLRVQAKFVAVDLRVRDLRRLLRRNRSLCR